MPSTVLSAKLPEDLIDRLGPIAAERGTTRNRLIRDALEAAVDGRVDFLTDAEREAERLQAVREYLSLTYRRRPAQPLGG
jgi:predicted transcriptional regulator